MSRRAPTGAAVLQPELTRAITGAVLEEWAAEGYGRLSMEAVARRAGVGKSALYRRWPSKQDMALTVVSEFSVARAAVPDTGSLRGDLETVLDALVAWLTHPQFARILPDLVAETVRNPELGRQVDLLIGTPRREQAAAVFRRAAARGEVADDMDLDLVLDLLAAPLYWRLAVRGVAPDPGYLERLIDAVLRLTQTPSP
jgi:AcrR family transcriptional regulator